MPVVVPAILRLGTDTHEDKHHGIGQQVRERMHGIGRHGGAVSHNAGHKLKHREQHICRAAHQCHFVYLAFAIHYF